MPDTPGRDAHAARTAVPKKKTAAQKRRERERNRAARDFAAKTSIFVPPALQGGSKPAPKPKGKPERARDTPGRDAYVPPKPKESYAQRRARETRERTAREKFQLGLPYGPTGANDLRGVPKGVSASQLKKNIMADDSLSYPEKRRRIAQVNRMSQTDLTESVASVGKGIGKTASTAGKNLYGWGADRGGDLADLPGELLYGDTNPRSPIPESVQRASGAASKLPGAKEFVRTSTMTPEENEAAAEAIFGKALTNLVAHGDAPGSLGEAAGLGVGLLGVLPLGKATQVVRLAAKAASAGKMSAKQIEAIKANEEMLVSTMQGLREVGNHEAADQIDTVLRSAGLVDDSPDAYHATPGVKTKVTPAVQGKRAKAARNTVTDDNGKVINVQQRGVLDGNTGPRGEPAVELHPGGVENDLAAAGREVGKHADEASKGKGRVGFLPPQAQTTEGLAALYGDLRRRLQEGIAAVKWYKESGAAILKAAGGNVRRADQLAAMTAIYSPQQAVEPNIGLALKAFDRAMKGETLPGSADQQMRALLVLAGKDWTVGYTAEEALKTRSFYGNLLKNIDPALARARGFNGTEVTNDGWIASAFGYGSNTNDAATFSNEGYRFMERTIQRLAQEAGVEPEGAQAAIWASIKANNDRHLAALYADPETRAQALERAGTHYEHGLNRDTHNVRMAFEGASSQIPGFNSWPKEAQDAYMDDVSKQVLDALHESGFFAHLSDDGLSAYTNFDKVSETNRGMAVNLGIGSAFTSRASRTSAKLTALERRRLTPAQRNLYHGVASALAYALRQEGVGWMKPVVAGAAKHGTFWRLNGKLDADTLVAVNEAVDNAGGYVSATDDGYLFVMYNGEGVLSKGASNRGFNDAVQSIAETNGLEVVGVGSHRGDFAAGEVEVSSAAIAASGRPDLLQRVADSLASSVDRTAAEYIERYSPKVGGRTPELAPREPLTGTTASDPGPSFLGGEAGELGLPRIGVRDLDEVLGDYSPRELTSGGKTQQMQAIRGRVGRGVQRGADAISRALEPDRSLGFLGDLPLISHASATGRVMRHAGRQITIEATRARGAIRQYEKLLPKRAETPEDIAHFWWAQLPPDYRNVEGLKLVREKWNENLFAIRNGSVLKGLQQDLMDIQREVQIWVEEQKMLPLEDRQGRPWHLIDQEATVRTAIADIPKLLDEMPQKIARLDTIIENPPDLNPDIIRGLRGIANSREKTLFDTGALSPEEAVERNGLVARWLDLEDTGEEIYMGHRIGQIRGANPGGLPAKYALGRPRSASGIGRQNRLVLVNNARVRETTKIAVDDWLSSQTFKQGLQARVDLGKQGEAFDYLTFDPKTEVIVNPKSRSIPIAWKQNGSNLLDQAVAAGYDEALVRKAADDLTHSYMSTAGDEASVVRVIDQARADGIDMSDLRVVRKKDADRYYKQFARPEESNMLAKGYDMSVDFMVMSVVFGRFGYVPKSIFQNIIMSVPHQGVYLFANAPRSTQLITAGVRGNQRAAHLTDLILSDVGQGAALTLDKEMTTRLGKSGAWFSDLPGKAAHAAGSVSDAPARMSAFLHEAAALGIIPRLKPVLDDRDIDVLLKLYTEEKYRPILNDIRSRTVEGMADFSRMTPSQRKITRRFLIVPGWLWAGSRYPIHFAVSYPGRTAAIGYAAAGMPYADRAGLPQTPSINDLSNNAPQRWLRGIPTPWGTLRTNSISPVATPLEMIELAMQGPAVVGENLNPMVVALYSISQGEVAGPEGSYRVGYWKSIQKNLERLVPNIKLLMETYDPNESSKYYPQDKTAWGRFIRELGVVPIEVTVPGENRSRSGRPSSKPNPTPGDEFAGQNPTPGSSASGGLNPTPP